MSLDRFRRTRMIVLSPRSAAYQAARAMADNHVGAVLIGDLSRLAGIMTDRDLALAVLGGEHEPKTTPLGEVMSEGVVTCDVGADLGEVARLMAGHAVRRIPVTENGRLVGLVTFDDLVVDGSVGLDALRAIVTAQLEEAAPQKPAGQLHPARPGPSERRAAGRARAVMRAAARAEATYRRLVGAVSAAAPGLEAERSERALLLGLCMLCRRLSPQEAHHLVAQLPSKLQPQLDHCLDGPDRTITADAIRNTLAGSLGLDAAGAGAAMRAVFRAVGEAVAAGQIDEVRGQLPEDMKQLFPRPAAEPAGTAGHVSRPRPA